MGKIIIVSNRLPVSIEKRGKHIEVKQSVGGLATGMKSIYRSYESIWIGWPGISDRISAVDKKNISELLAKEKCHPIYLNTQDIELFYDGFSNKTIWPLFHYFTQYAEYVQEYWEAYKYVNQLFANEILKIIKKGDKIWIHDYHLLLLPELIKQNFPQVTIGFFLHIPFPSYEVFRILPWRNDIINGMLGADLIGFHTYDYERHFLSCVRRLIGYDVVFNRINMDNRIAMVDVFPMGIDYNKFHDAALSVYEKKGKGKSKIQKDIDIYFRKSPNRKLILSIDRLDYTKGISNRLIAFDYFLHNHPEYREKVTLVLVSVPSRSSVEYYKIMKSEVDELVGKINGKYATINWTPIWYFYRTFSFENLVTLYTSCEIGLLTPIRDGMNLIAKEYIASKVDRKGILVLSEMAGASNEMSEAIIINPNNFEEISDAIKTALSMPEEQQIERNIIMQDRLKRYNVEKWAGDFMKSMEQTEKIKNSYLAKVMNDSIERDIIDKYKKSKKRIIFLDYDGTLIGFKNNPIEAKPDNELLNLLSNIASDKKNNLVIISGRDKKTIEQWLGNIKLTLIVEHGVWAKEHKREWELIEPLNNDWKEIIQPIIDVYVDRTPGSFIEEKNYSLVWHYRKADHELGSRRALELKDELTSFVTNLHLEILEGNKVVEIKNSGINKGRAAVHKLNNEPYDFIIGIGDDWTDEFLFEELPEHSITIKVGISNTKAKYNLGSFKDVRALLTKLI